MALKSFNPTSPSQRQLVIVDRSGLYKGKPEKALTEGLRKSGGRNNLGRVTAFGRGGGHKRTYRIVDFKRRKFDVPATVQRLEYDPNRSAFIALIRYEDGELAYIWRRSAWPRATRRRRRAGRREAGQRHADALHAGRHDRPQCGAEDRPRRARWRAPPGAYAQIVGRDQGYAIVKLGSGEQRLVHGAAWRRLARCLTRTTRTSRSARPAATAGWAGAERARRRHEPGRSPAWRRRRPNLGRTSSGHPVGQADQGQEDPLQQAIDEIHPALAARPQGSLRTG
jgi:large subunit ribosomal protein L2